MFKNYIMSALRYAIKDKSGSLINLLGLTVGFSIFVFAFSIVHYEKSYDNFFANSDRIVVPGVTINKSSFSDGRRMFEFFPGFADEALDNFPQIEAVSQIRGRELSVRAAGNRYFSDMRFVEPSFFDIFDLNYISGSPSSFREQSDGVFLSRSEAMTLFNTLDILDETIIVDNSHTLKIVGVYEDLPQNSHFINPFDAATSFDMLVNSQFLQSKGDNLNRNGWAGVVRLTNYILLREGTDQTALAADITRFIQTRISDELQEQNYSVFLQDVKELNLNVWERSGFPALLVVQAIGILILLVAILNTVSLSSARLIGRSREIGTRRLLGASRTDLIFQFVSEGIIFALIALFLSMVLLELFLPMISSGIGRDITLATMLNLNMIAFLIASAVFIGVLSSIYPILLLTGIAKGLSLNRTLNLGNSSSRMRLLLATAQFTVAAVVLFCAIVIFSQNTFLANQTPEFDTNKIVTIQGLHQEKAQHQLNAIIAQLRQVPGVDLITKGNTMPYSGDANMGRMRKADKEDDKFYFVDIGIDENYLHLFDIPVLAGRALTEERGDDVITAQKEIVDGLSVNILVNEAAVRRLGIKNNDDAIGYSFLWNAWHNQGTNMIDRVDRTVTIVGVVPDLSMDGTYGPIKPSFFVMRPDRIWALAVRFNNEQMVDISAINQIWQDLVPDERMEVNTLGGARDIIFMEYEMLFVLMMVISVIMLSLATTGLYALAAFLAATRRREVGIRKVLGAKTSQLIRLFAWQFSRPVFLSLLIGLPIGWFAMMSYLEMFMDRISLSFGVFLQAILIMIAVGFVTTITHVVRAARAHPSVVLRCE